MVKVRVGEVSLEVDPIPAAIAACMILGAIAVLRSLRRTAETPSPALPIERP
jgi:hypothetical protein